MLREFTHLFSDAGWLALRKVLDSQPLLAFDFDGTLAPIVMRPDDAHVSEVMARSLDRLSLMRPLAIVSGRSVDDVRQRMGFGARFVIGNHGAEDPGRAPGFDTAPLDLVRQRLVAHAEDLRSLGVLVEDKRYSITLHYRGAADQRHATERIQTLLADLPPSLRTFPGKSVVNVVATDSPDKYQAIAALMQRARCDSAVFVGDDVTDDAVFIGAPANWLTVRVGRDDPVSQAMFFLDQHAQVATLLDNMVMLLEGG
jgi:trehalose 6-phosphate phosphatase